MLGELLQDAVRRGVRLIHFIDRDDHRDVRGLRVVDGFDGLRHDTVVCRDDQDGDVGGHGTAGTHLGECGVTGGVEEGDALAVDVDAVRTDGLGDAAGLARRDVGVPDGVEDGGLTVVDVTHDADDRVSREKVGLFVFGVVDDPVFDGDDDAFLDVGAELFGDDGCGIEVDDIVDGRHLTERKQLFDDFGCGHAQFGSEFADGDLIAHLDGDLLLRALGRDPLETLLLGLPFAGTDTALFAVLFRFLVELLTGVVDPVVLALLRRDLLILFIIFLEVDVLRTGVDGTSLAAGTGLLLAVLVLLLPLLERMRVGVDLRLLGLLRLLPGRLLALLRRLFGRLGSGFFRSLFLLRLFLFRFGRFLLRLLLLRCRLLVLHREIGIEVLDLVVLGDVLEQRVEFILLQGRHALLRFFIELTEERNDVLRVLFEVFRDLMYSVFNDH